jgi:hypothetical protein
MRGFCAAHPSVGTDQTCERCGTFVCGECIELTATEPEQLLCRPCFTRYVGAKASTRAVTALVLAVVGIGGCWILGLPAWLLAEQELGAIERNESPGKGRNLALGAKYLGLIQLGLMVVIIGIGVLMFALKKF